MARAHDSVGCFSALQIASAFTPQTCVPPAPEHHRRACGAAALVPSSSLLRELPSHAGDALAQFVDANIIHTLSSFFERFPLKTLALAFVLALGALTAVPASAAERTVKITATNFAFTPGTITLKLHQRVKLHFVGKQGMHGIVIPDLGVNNVVNIGTQPVDVEVTPTKTGTFTAHCAVFCGAGHANMILTIKVVK